jgi:hypothetical protein
MVGSDGDDAVGELNDAWGRNQVPTVGCGVLGAICPAPFLAYISIFTSLYYSPMLGSLPGIMPYSRLEKR